MTDCLLLYVLTLLHLTLGLADPFLVTVGIPSSFSLTPCKTRSTGTDLDLSWCSGVSNSPADLQHKTPNHTVTDIFSFVNFAWLRVEPSGPVVTRYRYQTLGINLLKVAVFKGTSHVLTKIFSYC